MYGDMAKQASDVEFARKAENCGAQAEGLGPKPPYRGPSMAEMHGKTAAHHAEQADKSAKAQTFFATHPEFDEFIQLIRQGAIQI